MEEDCESRNRRKVKRRKKLEVGRGDNREWREENKR